MEGGKEEWERGRREVGREGGQAEGGRDNVGSKASSKNFSLRYMMSTRMWANAQRDGRPAEHRWRPLFNAAKYG